MKIFTYYISIQIRFLSACLNVDVNPCCINSTNNRLAPYNNRAPLDVIQHNLPLVIYTVNVTNLTIQAECFYLGVVVNKVKTGQKASYLTKNLMLPTRKLFCHLYFLKSLGMSKADSKTVEPKSKAFCTIN